MGTWSVDVLGGDAEMDALDSLGTLAGFDQESLYPLNGLPEDLLALLRFKLENPHTSAVLLQHCHAQGGDEEQDRYLTVLGAMHVASGARLPGHIRTEVAQAAQRMAQERTRDWQDPEARRDYMLSLARIFLEHQPGMIQDLQHVGLIEKIMLSPKKQWMSPSPQRMVSQLPFSRNGTRPSRHMTMPCALPWQNMHGKWNHSGVITILTWAWIRHGWLDMRRSCCPLGAVLRRRRRRPGK